MLGLVARRAAAPGAVRSARTVSRRCKTTLNVVMSENSEWAPKGTELSVSRGFARNFLFPRNLAVLATPASREELVSVTKDEYDRQRQAKRKEKRVRRRYIKMDFEFVCDADGTGALKEPFQPDTLLKHAERRYGISLQPDALELVGAEWPLPKLGTYALHLNVPEGYTIQQQVVLRAPEFNMDLVADVEETGEEEDE